LSVRPGGCEFGTIPGRNKKPTLLESKLRLLPDKIGYDAQYRNVILINGKKDVKSKRKTHQLRCVLLLKTLLYFHFRVFDKFVKTLQPLAKVLK
jgi:hypothetical protein